MQFTKQNNMSFHIRDEIALLGIVGDNRYIGRGNWNRSVNISRYLKWFGICSNCSKVQFSCSRLPITGLPQFSSVNDWYSYFKERSRPKKTRKVLRKHLNLFRDYFCAVGFWGESGNSNRIWIRCYDNHAYFTSASYFYAGYKQQQELKFSSHLNFNRSEAILVLMLF